MTADQESQFRKSLEDRSKAIQDDALVEGEWLKFCEENKHAYVSCLLGHNRILGKLNARGLLENRFYSRENLLRAKNMVCCETHREAIETIFANGML